MLIALHNKLLHCFTASLIVFCCLIISAPTAHAAGPSDTNSPSTNQNGDPCDHDQCDLVKKYLNPTINLLSVIFGLVAAGSLIMGGIQFSTSEGDPQKAARAKDRIAGTIFAIFAYGFLYAFLQFLIPGGIFR